MAGIGIAIGVDARTVKEAKRDVDALNRTLRETEEYQNLKVGADGLSETQAVLKRLGDELRRLKGLAREGERGGGILSVGQFREAGKLSRSILENFEKYHQRLRDANREIWRLTDAQAKLQDLSLDPKTGARDRGRYIDQIAELDEQIKAAKERRDAIAKQGGKFGAIAGEASEAAGQIGGFSQFGAVSVQRQIRKMLRWGLGIAGVTSLASFVSGSLSEAGQYADTYASARMRGVGRGTGGYGYSRGQTLGLADSLNRSTAQVGEQLDVLAEAVKKFSRAAGISGEAVAQYVGASFGLTGMSPEGSKAQLRAVYNLLTKIENKGRIEEFLQANLSLMERVAAASGGVLTPEQGRNILAMQAALFAQPGQIGKGISGANILGQVNEAIVGGGGSRGQQLALFHAFGGAKVRDLAGLVGLQRRMEEGAFGVGEDGRTNLAALMDFAGKTWGRTEDGQLSLFAQAHMRSMLGGLKWKQLDVLMKAAEVGASAKDIEEMLGGPGYAADSKKFLDSPEGLHVKTQAEMLDAMLKAGQLLLPAVDKFKDAVLDAADFFGKGQVWEGLRRAFTDNPIGQVAVGLLTVERLLPLAASPHGPVSDAAKIGVGAAVGQAARWGGRKALPLFGRLAPWAVLFEELFNPREAGRGSMIEDIGPAERERGEERLKNELWRAQQFEAWAGGNTDPRTLHTLEAILDAIIAGGGAVGRVQAAPAPPAP